MQLMISACPCVSTITGQLARQQFFVSIASCKQTFFIMCDAAIGVGQAILVPIIALFWSMTTILIQYAFVMAVTLILTVQYSTVATQVNEGYDYHD